MTCRVSQHVQVDSKNGGTHSCIVTGDTYPEFIALREQFEYFKIHNLRVTLTPLNNVSSRGAVCLPFCIAPYHRAPPNISYNQALTLDKCKEYRGTAKASRNFSVAAPIDSETSYPDSIKDMYAWSPKLGTTKPGFGVKHFGGVIVFDAFAESVINNFTTYYTLTFTSKITLYNQRKLV